MDAENRAGDQTANEEVQEVAAGFLHKSAKRLSHLRREHLEVHEGCPEENEQ
jgi:hypothetical protein